MVSFLLKFLQRIHQDAAIRALGLPFSGRWTTPYRIGNAWAGLLWLNNRDREITGFSTDLDWRNLPIKAVMEALEAVAIDDAGLDVQSRTGFAAHLTQEKARNSALNELLERDAFLFHWLTEIPGDAVEESEFKSTGIFTEELWAAHFPKGVELHSATNEDFVYLVGSRSEAHGCWLLGMGAANNRALALKKAVSEWVGAVYRHHVIGLCPAEKVIPEELDVTQPHARTWISYHHLLSKDPKVSALLAHIFTAKNTDLQYQKHKKLRELITAQTVFLPLPTRTNRYSVVLAKSQELLPLLFGPLFGAARSEYLANPRVVQALPATFHFHSSNEFLPHPFD